jgi:hypothetical protein
MRTALHCSTLRTKLSRVHRLDAATHCNLPYAAPNPPPPSHATLGVNPTMRCCGLQASPARL